MPFLVRIGRIDQNISGVGARGYAVFRDGRTVRFTFGKIEALGSGRTRFYWHSERTLAPKDVPYRSGARSFARALVREQLAAGPSGGYARLPGTTRILSPSR